MNSKNWLNWKCELSKNLVHPYDEASSCSNCGVFISKKGVFSYKPSNTNLNSQVVPLEHYHTILVDEKYQTEEYYSIKSAYSESRKFLIDMLFETGRKLRQTVSTIYLAIQYMDIIINTSWGQNSALSQPKSGVLDPSSLKIVSSTIPQESHRFIALICLNIASKFDALDLNTPLLGELQRASGCPIPYFALIGYESECLKILNWNLKRVTLFHWVENLKNQGFVLSDDTLSCGQNVDTDTDEIVTKANQLIKYFSEIILKDTEFLKFKPSVQAATCAYLSRVCLGIKQPWSSSLTEMLLYDYSDIQEAYDLFCEKYQFLVDSATDILVLPNKSKNLDLKNKMSYVPIQDNKKLVAQCMKKVKNLHDYTDRTFVRIRTCRSTQSSESSNKSSYDDMAFTEDEDSYRWVNKNFLVIWRF